MIPKLRIWDKVNKVMIGWKELDLTKERGENEITVFESTGQFAPPIFFYDAMESTRLKDSKGVEIFEHDIVKLKYPYDKRSTTLGVIVKSRQKACFGIQMKETTEDYELYRVTAEHYLEVVGNIYQNPELGIKPKRKFKLIRPKKVYYHAYINQGK